MTPFIYPASFYLLYGHRIIDDKELNKTGKNISTSIFTTVSDIDFSSITYGEMIIEDYFEVELGGKDEIEDLDESKMP